MKTNRLNILATAMMLGAFAQNNQSGFNSIQELEKENKTKEPIVRRGRKPTNRKDEVKPKGVKEYFFTENGCFFNSMPTGSYTIFYKCFALNDKNAKRKFDAYRKRNRGQ